jgi:hypothetical protein
MRSFRLCALDLGFYFYMHTKLLGITRTIYSVVQAKQEGIAKPLKRGISVGKKYVEAYILLRTDCRVFLAVY